MRVSILALAALLAAPGLSAQQVDRTRPPTLAPPAELRLPPIQAARLPNGIGIHLVEMHEVPLVQVTVRVAGG
ncbi:MAG TPA: hypothetical protein VNH46_13330, partial [Gemmatimonadales bacterium]|nr:hypothetical protein [Gemmatimonadales bacterium]